MLSQGRVEGSHDFVVPPKYSPSLKHAKAAEMS